MKKLLSLALACLLLFSLSACGREPKEEVSDEKPVIYLYPEQETDVRVTLDLAGELTCAYPAYGDGWSVRAAPDGTLTDESGQTYRYLYWEGTSGTDYDFSTGFCVARVYHLLAAADAGQRLQSDFVPAGRLYGFCQAHGRSHA